MEVELEGPAAEIRQLHRCINDLISVLALPAMWTGGEPAQILSTLLDSLLGMLRLDFIYVRLRDAAQETPIEMLRVASSWEQTPRPHEIGQILDQLGDDPHKWAPVIPNPLGNGHTSILPLRLGLQGEIGLLVAGSQRANFPEKTERLVLSVAANQAAIGLQEASLLSEQKRLASELDARVAQRTRELATANEELRKSEREAHLILDSIPGLIALLTATGDLEVVNRQVFEYSGRTLQELRQWATSDIVHPEDLPRLIDVFTRSIASGSPYDIVQRLRRSDGVYRWFRNRGSPLRDTNGHIVRWCVLLTDIDDRKRAEDTVRATERNLKLIIDTIPTMAWSAQSDGSADFFNQRWLEYTGLPAEQAVNWGWKAAIYPDDLPRILGAFQEAMDSRKPFEAEGRFRRHDGEFRWFLLRGNPLLDESGTIVKWYGTNTDVEDRKRAEKALRESEERARLIVDSIDALVMTATPKGEVEFVNQQVLDYFGKSLEELKGWDTSDAIHRDDLPHALAMWTHSVETGDPYQFEQRLRRADGAYRWFRVCGRCLREAQGQVLRWYVLLTDIDERKRAEAQVEQAYLRLAEAQRLSKTGSFITDLLVDDHNWSEEAFRIFEFDPAAKITVQMVRDMVHPEDLPLFDSVIARGMKGMDVDFVFRIVTSRGTVKHVRGMARVIEQIAGRPLFIGALQDVTDSKLAEEALNKARSELAHVARVTTLNALTASIAHEVNQPLSGIITNASTCLRMLNGDPPNVDGARETARRTIRDGNRASDVITRLRALFSKKEFTPEVLDLNEATREVITLSLSDLRRNRVIVRSELTDDLPPVTGDRVQLQQVILNLVRNASDAMTAVEDRPRELLIRTERDEADRVRLTVKDVGVGFIPEAADKLFEAFYTTKKDGMGIGLSISRSIIEAHQGRLWASPNNGPGSTFSFSIPCRTDTKVQ